MGKKIDYFSKLITEINNKENRIEIKNKILDEMERANTKEFILEKRERKIISTFIKKINKELSLEKGN